MKANELRIGNKVWFKDVFEWTITADDIVAFESDSEQFKPIEITEDWLVRFGFEKRESSVCDSFHIGINPITKDWLFDIVWLKDMKDYSYEEFPFYKNGFHELKHVHQLQNLYFALTGEELTVKE